MNDLELFGNLLSSLEGGDKMVLISKAFKKYQRMNKIAKKAVRQNLTSNYQEIKVQATKANTNFAEGVITREDARNYCRTFNSCLDKVGELHRRILVDYFFHGVNDYKKYKSLGLMNRRAYSKEKTEATNKIYELITSVKLQV